MSDHRRAGTDLARDDEPNRLDGARRELEPTGNLVLTHVDGVSGQESETTFYRVVSQRVNNWLHVR